MLRLFGLDGELIHLGSRLAAEIEIVKGGAFPVLFLEQFGRLRARRSACAVCIVSMERTAAMMRSTFTIISAGSPCRRSPAVRVGLRGFHGVVPVLRVVAVFDLVRRCIRPLRLLRR